jgi:hypothetical protein
MNDDNWDKALKVVLFGAFVYFGMHLLAALFHFIM